MRFRSLRLPAQTLRNFEKIILAAKSRLRYQTDIKPISNRYQTYGCAYFFEVQGQDSRISSLSMKKLQPSGMSLSPFSGGPRW